MFPACSARLVCGRSRIGDVVRGEKKHQIFPPNIARQAHGYLTPADAAAARNGANNSGLTLHGGSSLSQTGITDTTRLRNELEVVIVGCRGLPSRGGRSGQGKVAPAAYVHYQVTTPRTESQTHSVVF